MVSAHGSKLVVGSSNLIFHAKPPHKLLICLRIRGNIIIGGNLSKTSKKHNFFLSIIQISNPLHPLMALNRRASSTCGLEKPLRPRMSAPSKLEKARTRQLRRRCHVSIDSLEEQPQPAPSLSALRQLALHQKLPRRQRNRVENLPSLF